MYFTMMEEMTKSYEKQNNSLNVSFQKIWEEGNVFR